MAGDMDIPIQFMAATMAATIPTMVATTLPTTALATIIHTIMAAATMVAIAGVVTTVGIVKDKIEQVALHKLSGVSSY